MTHKEKIDNLIKKINEEYTSNHELTTKLCNYMYYSGQLQTIYEEAEKMGGVRYLHDLHKYRREEIDTIIRTFETEITAPIYKIVREAVTK